LSKARNAQGDFVSNRIAIFTCEYPPYPGGIATYTREVARAALKIGHVPVVYVFVDRGDLPDDGFEIVRLKPDVYSHARLPQLTVQAARVLAKRNFDIVFAADLENLIALSPISTRADKRAAVHGTDVRSRMLTRYFSTPLFRPLNWYQHIFANSKFTQHCLLEAHPYLESERVRTVALGVNDYWREPVSKGEIDGVLKKYEIKDDRFVAISVGRLEPRKGIHQAIEALRHLPPEIRASIVYLVVGRKMEGQYQLLLQSAAEKSGVDVRFLGILPADDIRALYQRAQILLHTATRDPRRVEGFGLTVVESAACGLPALVTRVDALPEVIKDNVTGFIVEDRDTAALSERIRSIFENSSTLQKMKTACRSQAKCFSWERCARVLFDGTN
jgi:phosphatidylinositol alpha-1,6-mannosyltransferase